MISNEQIQALKAAAESQVGILENIAGYEPDDIDGDDVELRFETEEGFDTGCNVSIVEQCQKSADVIRSLLAEREADKALIAEHERDQRIPLLKEKLAAAENLIAELESFKAAYMEWSDKTDWVQTDKRFDVLVPWGKHRADVLKEYITLLEARTLTVKLSDYSEFAIVHFTGCSDDYAKGWVDGRNTVNKAYSNGCAAAGITLVVGGGDATN